jgi:hypothetical protein
MRSVRPDNPDAFQIGAEPVGADLRQHRLDPLTDRGGAGDHLDGPIVAERNANIVERAEPAFLNKKTKPKADHLARLPTPVSAVKPYFSGAW